MSQGDDEVKLNFNLQTIPLMASVLNPDPIGGVGGGNITIVNDSALLSDIGPLGSIADIEESVANSDRISIYVVREGDSLSEIAEMFEVSVDTILWANDIYSIDLIRAGQVLTILPINGVRYTVKEGDTLESIAKKYKADSEDIRGYNDLPPDGSLIVGDTIIIPGGEDSSKPVVRRYAGVRVRGTSGPYIPGYYIRPIEGGRISQGLHGYNAIDFASYCGASILAAATGDVTISRPYGWNGGYGKYIVISHPNGTQTLYAHNSNNIVSTGWHVVQGQVIGYVGATGRTTGCHIHFEVRGAKNPF